MPHRYANCAPLSNEGARCPSLARRLRYCTIRPCLAASRFSSSTRAGNSSCVVAAGSSSFTECSPKSRHIWKKRGATIVAVLVSSTGSQRRKPHPRAKAFDTNASTIKTRQCDCCMEAGCSRPAASSRPGPPTRRRNAVATQRCFLVVTPNAAPWLHAGAPRCERPFWPLPAALLLPEPPERFRDMRALHDVPVLKALMPDAREPCSSHGNPHLVLLLRLRDFVARAGA